MDIGGGDDPHVDADVLRSADPIDHFLLEHAEQFRLSAGAHVADLIEKQRATIGQFELAGAGLMCVGEGSFFVPEQFALEQRLGQGRAVHRDKSLIATGAAIMQRLGHNFLTRPAVSQNENGQVGRGDAVDAIAERNEGRALADDPHALTRLFDQLFVLTGEPLPLLRVLDGGGDLQAEVTETVLVVGDEGPLQLVDPFEHSDLLPVDVKQRHTEQRSRPVAGGHVDLAVEALVEVGVVHTDHPARLKTFPDDPRRIGNAEDIAFHP